MNAATIIQSRPGRNGQERPARQTACAICDENPCRSPSFCRACRDADARKARGEKPHYVDASLWREPPHYVPALLDRSVSLERAWAELNRRRLVDASQATVEALLYELRMHGLAALKRPSCRRRLADVSSAQLRDVIARLIRLRPKYSTITDDLLLKLGEQL
jgi:hypothetical protein